jgi:RHS repeat-associated protein
VDAVVLMRDSDNGTLYALVTDRLNSVVAIVDTSRNVVETYDYTPFGKTTATGTDLGNTLGFTGREMGPNGLYYYRNRWYSPELGRFLETDPIDLAGWDLNLYRYVRNGPIRRRDPIGLQEAEDPMTPDGELPRNEWQAGGMAFTIPQNTYESMYSFQKLRGDLAGGRPIHKWGPLPGNLSYWDARTPDIYVYAKELADELNGLTNNRPTQTMPGPVSCNVQRNLPPTVITIISIR